MSAGAILLSRGKAKAIGNMMMADSMVSKLVMLMKSANELSENEMTIGVMASISTMTA